MKGLTLIELMVVIAIIVILASFSFVGYSSWVETQRAQDSVERLYKLLMHARSKSFFEKKMCGVCWNDTYGEVKKFFLKCDENGNGNLNDDVAISVEELKYGFKVPNVNEGCVRFYTEGYTNNIGTFVLKGDVDVPYKKVVISWNKIEKR